MFPKILAHRGASKKSPENTMAAFEQALKDGADGIELDVQLTKDGEIVVIHDEKLDRTTNMKGLVCSYALDELKAADAGSGERIPTLRRVFELLKGTGKILNIELKTGIILYKGIEQAVVNMIREFKYQEFTIISSFNHYSLVECKYMAPEIKTGILYISGLYKPWDYAATLRADALHPLHYNILNADTEQMQGLKASKLDINTFTVDNESDARMLIQKGVTSIITNVPDVMLNMMRRYHV